LAPKINDNLKILFCEWAVKGKFAFENSLVFQRQIDDLRLNVAFSGKILRARVQEEAFVFPGEIRPPAKLRRVQVFTLK
jgi:hypothetical protein